MSEPIVFISHFRVRQGKLDDLRLSTDAVTRSLEMEKPRTLVFLSYLDAEGTNVTFVHAFADAEAMDLHVAGAAERFSFSSRKRSQLAWDSPTSPSDLRRLAMLSEDGQDAPKTALLGAQEM